MSKRALSIVLVLAAAWPASTWAKGDPDDDDEEVADDEGDDGGDAGADAEDGGDADAEDGGERAEKPFKKQNLTGHAGTRTTTNLFEKDRFFVDKVDTRKTAKKTLIQGSLTSTSFVHREAGGVIPVAETGVPSNSPFTRLFTDLRLQTDFRHIGGGNTDARVDVRGRFVADPGNVTAAFEPATGTTTQSGLLGENELEIRELWVGHTGKRTDVFFGRQFVADLAGVKFDGLRVDYAKSSRYTLLGFGGLYPLRGSRSITTDYPRLLSEPNADGVRSDAGRFTAAAGFGTAYRTDNAYGSFGGVTLVPLSSEAPRVFGTSSGYWRRGSKLDVYHFAVLDAVGSNAVNAGLTNLSLGLNYKPDQRLRATLSFNRVDTETLNVQAQSFLLDPDRNLAAVQNEAFLIRIAQNQARASVSAGLGALQRFEITVATALRYRGEITLEPQGGADPIVLPPGKSAEVYAAITDRRSIADLRIGVDGSRVFRVGDASYQRTTSLAVRGFLARELKNGHGEWEAEVSYAQTKDDNAGMTCASIESCFGSAQSTVLSLGGNVFYRINRDWFAMGSAFLNRFNIQSFDGTMLIADPPVTGVSGFARIAYRF